MTEPTPAKPRFTRRRVLLGAMPLVVGLAVAGFVLGVFDKAPAGNVTVTFVRFQTWVDGKSPGAVVKVRNDSRRPFRMISQDGKKTVVCIFVSDLTHGWNIMGEEFVLQPSCEVTSSVCLFEDGRIGHVQATGWLMPRKPPKFLGFTRKLWSRLYPDEAESVWAVCDQRIQCPRVGPDGMVEPSRLLPKAEFTLPWPSQSR